jgi:hypothetical protein
VTKLIVDFRNFANAPKNHTLYRQRAFLGFLCFSKPTAPSPSPHSMNLWNGFKTEVGYEHSALKAGFLNTVMASLGV